MSMALSFPLALSPFALGAVLVAPLILLAIAYHKAGSSSLFALAQKVGGGSKKVEEKVIDSIIKLPDPSPVQNFDLKTARTRDHIYANKQLRYPYHQTMCVLACLSNMPCIMKQEEAEVAQADDHRRAIFSSDTFSHGTRQYRDEMIDIITYLQGAPAYAHRQYVALSRRSKYCPSYR